MAKIMACPICGVKFVTSRPNKKYCSFSCKEAGHKLKRMKWADKNPGYSASYMKSYRQKKRAQVPPEAP